MDDLPKLDDIDRKILRVLQSQADLSIAEVAERVGLSHTPCWRRTKRLAAEGVIGRRVALLDAERVGLNVTVFAYLSLKRHDEDRLAALEAAVQEIPEVVECYGVSGDRDYMLRVLVKSVADYEKLLKAKLVRLPEVANISSTFALSRIKYTTELPI